MAYIQNIDDPNDPNNPNWRPQSQGAFAPGTPPGGFYPGQGPYINNIGFQNTNDPRKMAANNRARIAGMGDVLNQEALDQAGFSNQERQGYLNVTDPAEQAMIRGEGGYTDQEKQAITGQFNPDRMNQDLQTGQGKQSQAVSDLQSGLKGSIDDKNLQQDPTLAGRMNDSIGTEAHWGTEALGYERGGLESGVSQEQQALGEAVDPNKLGLSSQFSNNYLMTPEQQQNIVTGAGISAGLKDSQAVGDLQRSAAAAGSSPMGIAAYRQRMARQQAADAGDAMTQARIGASNAAAARQQEMESMRLGSQQDIASRLQQNANEIGGRTQQNTMAIGQQGQALVETLGQQQRDAAMQTEQNRQQAQQYLTGAKLQSATTGGEAALQNAQTSTAQTQGQNQYNTNTGVNMQTGIANTRLGGTYTGLQNQDVKGAQSNQNAQNAYNRQQQTYATSTGGTNQATQTGLAASQTPTGLDKAIGAGIGIAGAAAGFVEDGGVFDSPTVATIGENGPEAVVPLGSQDQSQPWWKRIGQIGQQPGMQSTMQNASKMAAGGNPYGGLATAGAGLIGGYLRNRQQNKLNGQVNDLGSTGFIPAQPPQIPPPPSNQSPMAKGSIVTKPTVAMLGDRGPEAVVPLDGRKDANVRPGMLFGRRRMYGQAA